MDPLIQLVHTNPKQPDSDVFLWYNDKEMYSPSKEDWKKRLLCLWKIKPDRFIEYAFRSFTNYSIATAERPFMLLQCILDLSVPDQRKILEQYAAFTQTDGNIKKFQRAKDILLNPQKLKFDNNEASLTAVYLNEYEAYLQCYYPNDRKVVLANIFENRSDLVHNLRTEHLEIIYPTLDDVEWSTAKAIIQRWTYFVQNDSYRAFCGTITEEHNFFERVKSHPRLIEVLQAECLDLFKNTTFSNTLTSNHVEKLNTNPEHDTQEAKDFEKSVYSWILRHAGNPNIIEHMRVFDTPVKYEGLTKKQLPVFEKFKSAMIWMMNLHPDDYEQHKEHIWKKMPTPDKAIIRKTIVQMSPQRFNDLLESPLYMKIIESLWEGNATAKQYMAGVLSNKLGVRWDTESPWIEKACLLTLTIQHVHNHKSTMAPQKLQHLQDTIRIHSELLGPIKTNGPPWDLIHTLNTQINTQEIDCSDILDLGKT